MMFLVRYTVTIVVILFVVPSSVCNEISRPNITGNATCDDAMEFYVDGVQHIHGNDDKWEAVSPINIPGTTQVIAIKCTNVGSRCGISAVLSNGIKTDTSWKCSDEEEDGWNTVSFDDSAWTNAKQLVEYSDPFIWTTENEYEIGTIYCRKSISQSIDYRNVSYSKSSVVINTCDPSRFLELIYAPRKMDCARACAEKADCKRYLYCSSNSSCNLYQDGRDCVMSSYATGCSCYAQNIRCEDADCTCSLGKYGQGCHDIISDCTEGFQKGLTSTNDALTNIKHLTSPNSFEVLCTFGDGGWTGIFGRNKDCLHDNFSRTLEEYEEGFGNVASNKWLGFKHILYLLDNPNSTYSLRVVLIKPDSSTCISQYTNFIIGNKSTSYKLYISGYGGNGTTCGDSLTGTINLNSNPFSTYDADYTGIYECANRFGGGWWYDRHVDCTSSLLTRSMDDNFWNESLLDSALNQIYLQLQRN